MIDLHHDARSRQRNISAVDGLGPVLGQQVVGQGHHDGNGKLGDEAAQAKDHNVAAGFGIQAEGGFIQADRFKPGHVGNGYHERSNLADDCGNGGTLDSHLKGKDKHGVQNHVENGSDDHGEHGILGTAVRPDHRVNGAGNHHERKSNADDPAIFQRIGTQCIRGTEQRKDRVNEDQEYSGQDDADYGHHGYGVADSCFCAAHVAFPQLKA